MCLVTVLEWTRWDLWLPVALAVVWIPNYMGVVAGRYVLATPRHRPLVAWITFAVGCVWLCT